jgi:O-antigen biosynthesis protein
LALVSCIMPTANRRRFVPEAIRLFLRQDYKEKELLILDDGDDLIGDLVPAAPSIRYMRCAQRLSIGAKRNLACAAAYGDIIAHWDDDDWYAPWRLTRQVNEMIHHGADLCGLDRVFFFDPAARQAWEYVYPVDRSPWLYGATLCYRKQLWKQRHFQNIAVGEDTLFIANRVGACVRGMPEVGMFVGLIHGANSSPKRPLPPLWRSLAVERIESAVGDDWCAMGQQRAGPPAAAIAAALPLVSCIMPTRNRAAWVPQSIHCFQRQDYPHRELIIIDDGVDDLDAILPADRRIRHIRVQGPVSIGEKRNRACEAASGTIIAQWDDDDWYAPGRLSAQVAPLLAGVAEISALRDTLFLDLERWQFWKCSTENYSRLFVESVAGGTLVFQRKIFGALRYPDLSLAEDAIFLQSALRSGMRLQPLDGRELFVYVRHANNSWHFACGKAFGTRGWQRVSEPAAIADEQEFYVRISERVTQSALSVALGARDASISFRSAMRIRRSSKS